mmetsp:Transcript_17569/g.24381  ORF Transcript_17569/g.24381 Transcript_17569/m.24381 type:complete len:756 (-) Transcript_17569:39-2306(-)
MADEWGSQLFNEDAEWVRIQTKTFTRWANTYLKERMDKIDNLQTELADGLKLISLLEIISSKQVNGGKYNKKPKIRSQYLENLNFALDFLRSENIKLVNIGAEDISDQKLKLILGLIWTIILRYQINIEAGKSARSDLLKWVQKQIPEYHITNFTTDWNNGKAICALSNSLMPGICPDHWGLNPNNALENATRGTDIAEKDLEIPKVLAPEDMINPLVDELSVMTYISYFRDWEAKQLKKKSLEEQERTTIPEKCRAYGPGWEKGETNTPTEFTIEAINVFGRRVPHGADPFEITLKGPKDIIPHKVTDHGDGTYTVSYTPQEVGRHTFSVNLHNKPISNSPKIINIARGGPDAAYCKAYGPGLEKGEVLQPAHFTIESRNKNGDRLKDGGDPFQVKVTGPYNYDVPVTVADNKDGTYSVTYNPIDHGEHKVEITLHGAPVADSPYTVGVHHSESAPDALQCVAYGPGLEGGNTSDVSHFTVETRNQNGARLHTGGWPVDVDVLDPSGSEVPVKVKDNNDGTFSVEYAPKEKGDHTVHVVLRHQAIPLYYQHIKDSPFRVTVVAGTDASKSSAYGPGLENGIPDNLPTYFTIQAKDKDGNNMKQGGEPFQVKIHGPNGEVPAKITDKGDGTYLVEYEPTQAGKHKVDVTLKGHGIEKNPFSVNVREGADDKYSHIEGYTFTIRAQTKQGQNKKDGGDNFKVTIHGSAGEVKDVHVKDIGDGTYLVSYKLPGPGEYTINVTVNDKHIKGSPWKVYV